MSDESKKKKGGWLSAFITAILVPTLEVHYCSEVHFRGVTGQLRVAANSPIVFQSAFFILPVGHNFLDLIADLMREMWHDKAG